MEIIFNDTDPIWDIDKFRRVLGEMHYGQFDVKREVIISLPSRHYKAITDSIKLDAGMVFNVDALNKTITSENTVFDHFTTVQTGTVYFKEI